MPTTHETLAQHTRHRSHRKSTHTHSLAHSHSHSLTHSYIRVAGESRAEWCHSPVLRAHKHLGIVHAATACGGPGPIRPFQLMLTLIRGGASSDSYSSVPRAMAMTLVRRPRRAAPQQRQRQARRGFAVRAITRFIVLGRDEASWEPALVRARPYRPPAVQYKNPYEKSESNQV